MCERVQNLFRCIKISLDAGFPFFLGAKISFDACFPFFLGACFFGILYPLTHFDSLGTRIHFLSLASICKCIHTHTHTHTLTAPFGLPMMVFCLNSLSLFLLSWFECSGLCLNFSPGNRMLSLLASMGVAGLSLSPSPFLSLRLSLPPSLSPSLPLSLSLSLFPSLSLTLSLPPSLSLSLRPSPTPSPPPSVPPSLPGGRGEGGEGGTCFRSWCFCVRASSHSLVF